MGIQLYHVDKYIIPVEALFIRKHARRRIKVVKCNSTVRKRFLYKRHVFITMLYRQLDLDRQTKYSYKVITTTVHFLSRERNHIRREDCASRREYTIVSSLWDILYVSICVLIGSLKQERQWIAVIASYTD